MSEVASSGLLDGIMKGSWLCAFLACACLAGSASGPAEISVGRDGSVHMRFQSAAPKQETVLFQFGLPRVAPQKTWAEKEVLLTVWITNGVRYEQTVLLSSLAGEPKRTVPRLVLLINLAGENGNSEYAQAAAELSMEIGGKRQKLEFSSGLVWRTDGANRSLVGALDIPAPGVNVSRGEALLFSGNMPPSEKGSMTLKVPLDSSQAEVDLDELRDLVFAEELGRHLKSRSSPTDLSSGVRLFFADEAGPDASRGKRENEGCTH